MNLTEKIFAKRGTWELFESVGGYDLSLASTGYADRLGQLWLPFNDSIICTDGNHLVHCYDHSFISGSKQGCNGFSHDDKYWVITSDFRLLAILLEDGSVEDHTDNLPSLNDAYWLWTFKHNDILIGFHGKLLRYDGKERISEYDVPKNEQGRIHAAGISPDGHLWFTSHLGLHSAEENKVKLWELPSINDTLWEFIAINKTTVWLAYRGKFLYVEDGKINNEKSYDLGESMTHKPLLIDDENNFWVAFHFRGTICMNPSGSVSFPFEETPGLSWPKYMVQDKSRSFWFIGVGNGIIRYNPDMLNVFQRGYFEAAAMGTDHKLRVTAASKGLLEYDGKTIKQLCDGLPGRCFKISLSENNDIYISSPYGLFVFDVQKSEFRSASKIPEFEKISKVSVYNTAWDHEGNLWLSNPYKIYCYCKEKSEIKSYSYKELGLAPNSSMFQGKDNTIWFMRAADSPIISFGQNGFSKLCDKLGDWVGDYENIPCFQDEGEGTIWIGTHKGIIAKICKQTGKIELQQSIDLDNNATLRHIRIDDSGRKWISSTSGLYICDENNVYRMTEAALLPSRRIVATYDFKDDIVLIVTELGLCEYKPNRNIRPKVLIDKVIADKIYKSPENLISEKGPIVSIHLTSHNMKTGPLKYKIRMRGLDDTWKETYEEKFDFKDLPVGKYTFEAKAIDQDLMTSEETAKVDIEVIPNILESQIAELEGELQGAKDYAENIIKSINDAIMVLNTKGRIVIANHATLNLLGYDHLELIGKPVDIIFSEKSPSPFDYQGLEKLKGEGNITANELGIKSKDGSEISVMFSASCMFNRTGELQGFIIAATDISEYKALQDEMLQNQKMESLGLLAGGIAHDFNNFLEVMIGNASFLLLDLDEKSDYYQPLTDIVSAGRQASKLCSELLVYSGKGKKSRTSLNLSEIVKKNVQLLQTSIKRKIAIEYSLEDDLPDIWGDDVQLMQIVMNLVLNSAQAIGDNTGVISISTRSEKFTSDDFKSEFCSGSPESGRYVLFEVKDTGCGMDHETQMRIFEPFFTTKKTGRGLGLAAIHGIVKSHNGVVKVESEPGKGTTFQIFLPVFEGEK